MKGAHKPERILIIKLGALGDFIQSLGPMQAIRRHHPAAQLTLLTTASFVEMARASGLFDEIWGDGRPRGFIATLTLARRLSWAGFRRIYDLQTQSRTNMYFHLLWPKAEWSGTARGASLRHDDEARKNMHVTDAQRLQLELAGITDVHDADLSFLRSDISALKPAGAYVLLVPGGATHRPQKRWPVAHYAALAHRLQARGLIPVIIGGKEEAPLAAAICDRAQGSIDLTGRTDFSQVASLARDAQGAVGNDTGPMHIIARAPCPSLVLFSAASDPALCAPKGPRTDILHCPDLEALTVEEVEARFCAL